MSTNGTSKPDAASPSQRATITPESETRGGPEAPQQTLDAHPTARPTAASDRMPGVNPEPGLGSRAALPEGTLPGPYLDTQGDENRQPPDNAPAPVNPTITVDTVGRGGAEAPDEAGLAD
jgi:hypothetical protein